MFSGPGAPAGTGRLNLEQLGERLRAKFALFEELEGYLDDPDKDAQLIREAEASGFQFDD
ncbi:MAG TPA: hypothetical protein VGH53_14900 [Streptosporangiaceae bacterium]